MISHVRETLKEHRRVQSRIHDFKGLSVGEVTLATMNGLASGILPRIAAEFGQRHPRANVSIRSLFVDEIIHAVVSGEADLGLGYNLPSDPRVRMVESFDTRLGAVVAPTHPLALRSPVRLSECAAYPIILSDGSMTIHQIMIAAFARSDLVVEPTFRSNSLEYMKIACALRHRRDLLQRRRRCRGAADRCAGVPPDPGPARASKQPLSLVQRAKRTLETTPSLFLEEIRDALRGLVHKA